MKKRTYQLGPCGPELDDWGWACADYIKEYKEQNPNTSLTDDQLKEEFMKVVPPPQPKIYAVPTLREVIAARLSELKGRIVHKR